MRVTVLLIAYHGDSWLLDCIMSLRSAYSSRLNLVLVDNWGNNKIDQLPLDGFDTEVIRTPRAMGFAEANNFALIRASKLGDTIAFLNQDTISQPDWIDRCVDSLYQSKRRAAISPIIRNYTGEGWDGGFLHCLPGTKMDQASELLKRHWESWVLTDSLPATALLVKKDALVTAGPFDPLFGSYYEDYDLCARIQSIGYLIGFCGRAQVNHFGGGSTITPIQSRSRMRLIVRNRVIHRIRNSPAPRCREVARNLLLDFPRNFARGIIRTPSSQPPSVTLMAYWDLLRIADRLISAQRDQNKWRDYLEEICWPP